jgi:radical SAM superfamily enzyme YgiQ (UPF0313 family)
MTTRPLKIGFYALSGVRVCDPKLLELGFTLPGFVERSKVIASLPSLGLLTLAGMCDPRDERIYIEVGPGEDPPLDESLDLIVISTLTAQALDAYRLADRFRAVGRPVVMGGLHVTSLPGEALRHADAVVVGEGETVWPQVLDDARAGRLQGTYDARGSVFDLAEAPMPAFELLEMDRYNRITVQATRGCPWRCEFCASSILLTPKAKTKPIAKVLAEIDAIAERWPRPFIEFADDNSFVHRAYWKQLLPELAKRRVRWFTETDISVAEDEELLELMRDAGCAQVLIGLESPDEPSLTGLELLSDWKRRQRPHYREAIRRIQSHGIRVNGCFVLGLDAHGPDIFDRVYDAARDYQLYDVQITLQTPFPGTPLYQRLDAENRLTLDGQWDRCTLFDQTHEPAGMTREQLQQGFYRLTRRLYSEAATRQRREHFEHQWKASRRAALAA